MIVTVVIILLLFSGLVGLVSMFGMTPEEHRAEADREAIQASRSRSPRRATGHMSRAEAHLYLAERGEHGRSR